MITFNIFFFGWLEYKEIVGRNLFKFFLLKWILIILFIIVLNCWIMLIGAGRRVMLNANIVIFSITSKEHITFEVHGS